MAEAKDAKQAALIASQINACWKSQLGTKLKNAYLDEYNEPVKQVRRAIRIALNESDVTRKDLNDIEPGMEAIMYDDEVFEQTSMTELMEVLKQLPEWDKVAEQLSSMTIEEGEEEKIDF